MTDRAGLLLPVGDDLYALPLDWVREVVAAPTVTPSGDRAAACSGCSTCAARSLPLLDTAALLGIGTDRLRPRSRSWWTVPHGPAGLAATGFPQRRARRARSARQSCRARRGCYQVDQRIAVLLDPDALLTPERVGGLRPRSELTSCSRPD